MRAVFALLGLLLIASGAIILGAPYLAQHTAQETAMPSEGPSTRSLERRRPGISRRQTWLDQVQAIAEKINAPLSIVFGFISLLYTRRTYHAQRNR